jgi:hypothetical protein
MPFTLQAFSAMRPYAFHLTAEENLRSIRERGRLESASLLMDQAGRPELLRLKRSKHVSVFISGVEIQLRDQAPLHAANVAFEQSWGFADLVEELNKLVFFWPGKIEGPNQYGRRHFDRYRSESPVLLRVRTDALIARNSDIIPLFCRYNSGSPRYSGGNPSPRGPSTFLSVADFPGRPGHVVELTFPGRVALPNSAEFGFTPDGPWHNLYTERARESDHGFKSGSQP